ncbi:hypothetical protein AB0D24_04615 [Streptomyces javensis]|uniref:hypothetical protein n=1 Tax=Streptomyces javensis TaxID=114698 RepID=UPI0033CEB74F
MAVGGNFSNCNCGPDTTACENPTQPVATVGLCLADGRPIAVTVVRDCAGNVTSEGWVDLTNGQFTAAPPPTGTIACGDTRSIQVSGTFCDVAEDGSVLGLVLVEYRYAADGSIESVRLVDATTGGTYTPAGNVTTCPADVQQPERDLLQLCDISDDESGAVVSVPFVRDYQRDETGQITGHTDYDLAGQPYTPVGEVTPCSAVGGGTDPGQPEPCRDASQTLLCDVAALDTVAVLDTDSRQDADGWQVSTFTLGGCTGYAQPDGPVPGPPVWSTGGYLGVRADRNLGTGSCSGIWAGYDTAPIRWVLTKTFTAAEDGTAVVEAHGLAADGGVRVRVNGTDVGLYAQWNQPAVGGSSQVPVTAGPNIIELEIRDIGGPNYVRGRLDIVMNRTQQFMRKIVTDCETGETISVTDTTLDGQPYTVTGEVGQCTPAAECCEQPPPETRVDVENDVLCLVDDATGNVTSRVLVERVYDDQTGERVEQRLVDPVTGEVLEVPAGAHLGECCETTREAVCVAPLLPTSQRVVSNPGNNTSGRVDPAWTWGLTPTGGRTVYDVTPSPAWTTPLPPGGGWVSLTPTTATSPLPSGTPATYYMVTAFELPDDAVLDATTVKIDTLNADNSVWGYALNDAAETATNSQTTWFNQPPYTEAEHRIQGAIRGTNLLAIRVVESNPPSPGGVLLDVTLTYRVPGTPEYWTVEHRDCGTTTYIDPDGNQYEDGLPDGYMACGGGGGSGAPAGCCPDAEPVLLCDVAEDGTSTPFLRHLAYKDGTLTDVADTTLDGQPYTVTGDVGQCTAAGGGTVPEPCRDTSTVLLCDVATQGEVSGTLTAAIIGDPAPFNAWRGYGEPPTTWCQENGDPGTVFSGGSATLGPGTVCTKAGGGTHEVIAAVLGAAAQDCTNFTVTASVRVTNTGPTAGYAGDGRMALWNTRTGTLLTAAQVEPSTPVGDVQIVTVSAPVSGADLTAGCIAVSVDLEVEHHGAKAWTVDQFTADYQAVCLTSTQFLRHITTDCATGTVLTVTDITLDGEPYTVTGDVGQCTAAGDDSDPERCRNTSTLLLCDLPEAGEPDPTLTDTDPAPYYPYPEGLPTTGGQTLWDGGTLNLPAGTGPQPGTVGAVNLLAATIQALRPTCDDGTAHVTVSVDITQDGPDDGCGPTGHLRLFNGTAQIALAALPSNAPVGWTGTLTVEAEVPAADIATGTIAAALALDAFDGSTTCTDAPRETAWTLSNVAAGVVYAQAGCVTQFLRTLVVDCDSGQVMSVTDTTLDGEPYTVTAVPGQCTPTGGEGGACCPAPEPEEPAPGVAVVQLCDTGADGTVTAFLRHLVYAPGATAPAVTDTALDGLTPYTPAGTVSVCGPQDENEPCPAQNVVSACRCDDTDGDGVADTDYVELLGVDCDGVLTSIGTYLPDLSAPYTPVAPVDCGATVGGADPVRMVQAHRVQLAAGGTWTAGSVTMLQSVTVTAHGGTGTIATDEGTTTLYDGESVTWSVAREDDTLLTGPLTITADTGVVTVTYTSAVTA